MEINGSVVIAIFGLVLTVLNIIDKFTSMKKSAGEPLRLIEGRVRELEVRVEEHTRFLQTANDALKEQQDTNEVIQQCILALLDFEISYCLHTDYPHTADLEEAKKIIRGHLGKH